MTDFSTFLSVQRDWLSGLELEQPQSAEFMIRREQDGNRVTWCVQAAAYVNGEHCFGNAHSSSLETAARDAIEAFAKNRARSPWVKR